MEKQPRKLTLSKETLRTLDDDQLRDVAGGATGICLRTTVCHSGVCNSVACESVVCYSAVIC